MNNIIEQKIKSLESAKKMYSLFFKIFENLILAKKIPMHITRVKGRSPLRVLRAEP